MKNIFYGYGSKPPDLLHLPIKHPVKFIMTANYAIDLKELYKRYPGGETPALNNLSFRFRKGIIAGILGPNGAGKTTTLSIICGLVRPDSGTATVLGMDCLHQMQEIKQCIGIVPQQIALYPRLTLLENLRYIGRLYELPTRRLQARIRELLADFSLLPHARKKIDQYSGGMKRRANIIAALLHEPEILILDEPTAGVDVQSRAMILDFLKRYHQLGKSIIYTSHLLDEAEKICEEVAIIDEGSLIAQASPHRLIAAVDGCTTLEDVFIHYTGRSVRL